MPPRPEGPAAADPPLPQVLGHTPSWTPGDVLLWMMRAWATNPRTRSPAEVRPLNWPNEHLALADPRWALKRDILLCWCRCRADRTSFQEFLRDRPHWGSSATVYRLRDEAAAEIAEGINAAIARAHADVKKT